MHAPFTQVLNTGILLDTATVNLCPEPIDTAILHNYIARSDQNGLELYFVLWIKLPGYSH
jgi:hypothetical protein